MVQLIKLPWTEIPRLGMRSAVNCREPQYSDKLALSPRASELFGLYFDDEVLEIMVLETNRYEKQINRKKWQDIAKDKLKALLGIILVMGVIPSHHLYLCWSSDPFFNVPEISSVMRFKRFQTIRNTLNNHNNQKVKRRGKNGFDKLAKIRPLLNALNHRF